MSITDIVKSVRLCIDEDISFAAQLLSGDDTYGINKIIRDKIPDALRWVCLYAPPELLAGSDETETEGGVTTDVDTGILVDVTGTDTGFTPTPIPSSGTPVAGRVQMPSNFIKLARARVAGWHRAVKGESLLREDSDEYLQLYDDVAKATAERPQAALIEKKNKTIELWPWTTDNSFEITYVASVDPKGVDADGGTTGTIVGYALPPLARTSFIYYLAFLLLSAYGDERATRMLEIARMNLGKTA